MINLPLASTRLFNKKKSMRIKIQWSKLRLINALRWGTVWMISFSNYLSLIMIVTSSCVHKPVYLFFVILFAGRKKLSKLTFASILLKGIFLEDKVISCFFQIQIGVTLELIKLRRFLFWSYIKCLIGGSHVFNAAIFWKFPRSASSIKLWESADWLGWENLLKHVFDQEH